MSSLLGSLKTSSASTSASDIKTESIEVVVGTLSALIDGKFGKFRQFTMNGQSYNVDESRVQNAIVFKPNAKATLSIQQYTNAKAEVKTVIAGLLFHLPEGSGLFIMR